MLLIILATDERIDRGTVYGIFVDAAIMARSKKGLNIGFLKKSAQNVV